MKLHPAFTRFALVFVYLAVLLGIPQQATAQPVASIPASPPAKPRAADPAPVTALRGLYPFDSGQLAIGDAWLIGGGYLYWAQCVIPGPRSIVQSVETQANPGRIGYLRRWPIRGGAITTLSSDAFCGPETSSWAADDSGLYYWQAGFIYRRSLANALTPVAVVDTGVYGLSNTLAIDSSFLYYSLGNNFIYRTPKAQTNVPDDPRYDETVPMLDGGAGTNGLILNGNAINWFGGGRVRSAAKTCAYPDTCPINNLATESGAYLSNASIIGSIFLGTSTNPLWVSGPIETTSGQTFAGNQIRSYFCQFQSTGRVCNAGNTYTAPNRVDSSNTSRVSAIGPLASDGNYLFWIENLKSCANGPFGYSCQQSSLGRLMKYHIGRSLIGSSDPFDTPQPIATQNSSGVFSINGTPPVAIGDGWVYFDTSNGLSRIRADAPPISWDLAFNSWEITQGIQNLSNDVPLVANKPTFVRVYGNKLSGPSALNVEGILSATTANGAAFGTLRSLNGPQNFTANNGTPNRAVLGGGWLFQLPDSWVNIGVTKLSFQIDPRGVWNDPNRGNNSAPLQAFAFTRKAPICIVTIPVRTHAPAASNSDPSLFRMADVTRQMLPTSDVWIYHQDDDVAQLEARFGIPPWKYEPYAVPDKGDNILKSLWLRDAFSDDPDRCDDAGALTHYVGLVHSATNTNTGTGTNLGLGYNPGAQLYVKLIDPATLNAPSLFWKTQAFDTLAHELSHNYGRQHVNCGGAANNDGGYPYRDGSGTNCVLDDAKRGSTTLQPYQRYYGFDTQSQTPIDPGTTADYMAYRAPFWISDYTWRALFGRINSATVSATASQEQDATAQTRAQITAAASVVYITGSIDPTANTGSLDYSWVYPSAALSAGMQAKLLRNAAPQASENTRAAGSYTLRLRDAAGTLLDERAITLQSPSDNEGTTAQPFVLTFPAPTSAVARLELVSGGTVLASLAPGSAAPNLTMLSPAGGETIDTSMTLSWRASDADASDRLLFSVQYSPDNGQHWRALLTGLPNRSGSDTLTLTLDSLSGIPASTSGGLIRVAASDGYNTTIAVSQPFTVVNRAPEPVINAPGTAPLLAGQTIIVNGSATDVEDGGLSGAALRWAVDGVALGNGQSQTIEGLAPGSHTLTLIARDSAGKEAPATQMFTVAPLAIPKVTPIFDGDCNDTAYLNAARVALAPYADGTQAFVTLARTDDALYACFSGMKRTAGSSGTLAVVRVNSDYGQRSVPAATDHVFYTDEAGAMSTYNGNGVGYVAGSGGASAQISANSVSWNAELRIDAGAIGGMNHVIGLDVEQALVTTNSDRYTWPKGSGASTPSNWGAASLGDAPQISQLAPASATVGAGDTLVTINGSGFAAGATAQLNGTVLATTVVSTTQVQATIPAAKLATADTLNLVVANPGLAAAPSNALPFAVTNPLPQISKATLVGTTLTIIGSNFATGATVQFNGTAYPATGNSTQLSVTVSADDLVGSADAPITVFNPGPGGGVSNIVRLGAVAALGSTSLYLPLVTR